MFGMTPRDISKEEKIPKNTVNRKHHGYVILGRGHVVILVSLLPIDAATNCDQSHEALRSLNSCFRLVRFTREIWETLPLHDKIRPHSNVSTTEDIVPAHCLNPVLVLPYIHLSGSLKESPRGQNCIVDVALQNAFRPWLLRKEGDFAERGYTLLLKG